ncbi:bis(5'-nucleosyl)-tetraphosphatase (symmetrical) YqeK [Fusobacterium sp. oral taxon 203]|uniref:bis(5'-nucleosyl)-tetraphosphatase (symmetrical) YqeK n=1 Tax=Fusobacterium sp. oral taxon 203 TaxID=671211 RepID=UPI000B926104|nr:bis(5'-nucleosyl)-tetraphosphatase (symmetrical) YqeK [Fusobacterium sp. oral taxon 203]ASS40245.1 phosphohydrolase [Fusobacterium sp. oral taxon 203]
MKYNFKELKEIVKSKMSLKRFTHTLGVVEMSEKLAKTYNADIEKCKVAALLHDICKEMDMEYIKNICKDNFMNELSEEDLENNEILHGFAGAYYVKNELGINDKEILSAIKYHTVGAENMTSVEKIVYIADAIEYGRNYPSVVKIREETFKNLDRGILMEIEHKEKYLESIGKKSHPNTDELKKEIIKELDK